MGGVPHVLEEDAELLGGSLADALGGRARELGRPAGRRRGLCCGGTQVRQHKREDMRSAQGGVIISRSGEAKVAGREGVAAQKGRWHRGRVARTVGRESSRPSGEKKESHYDTLHFTVPSSDLPPLFLFLPFLFPKKGF